jgi:hypothetical protein
MEVTVGISEPVTSRSNKSCRPTRATYAIQFSSSRSSTFLEPARHQIGLGTDVQDRG